MDRDSNGLSLSAHGTDPCSLTPNLQPPTSNFKLQTSTGYSMPTDCPMVLYSIVVRRNGDGTTSYLVRTGADDPTFPPTKLKDGGDLYLNLDRIFGGDFGLPRRSYYAERELPTLDNAPDGPHYDGLPDRWLLYPVIVSLTADAHQALESASNAAWLTLDELAAAGAGELAGVGRLGVSGKTVCDWSTPQDTEAEARQKRCSNHGCCVFPPALHALMAEYRKPFPQRDYARIAELG